MLSYDESKRLKELGYPQELKEGDWVYLSDGLGPVCVHTPRWYADIPYIKVPTTDGMIEGLGDEPALLTHCYDGFGDYNWAAESRCRPTFIVGGETIDQALCELWKKVKAPNDRG